VSPEKVIIPPWAYFLNNFKYQNRKYCTRSTHIGNSSISYYPQGSDNGLTYGIIDKMFTMRYDLKTKGSLTTEMWLEVLRFLPLGVADGKKRPLS
jgi:hypothetical protein